MGYLLALLSDVPIPAYSADWHIITPSFVLLFCMNEHMNNESMRPTLLKAPSQRQRQPHQLLLGLALDLPLPTLVPTALGHVRLFQQPSSELDPSSH